VSLPAGTVTYARSSRPKMHKMQKAPGRDRGSLLSVRGTPNRSRNLLGSMETLKRNRDGERPMLASDVISLVESSGIGALTTMYQIRLYATKRGLRPRSLTVR
jgi:hypothetical protein